MLSFVDDKREPKPVAYVIGAALAGVLAIVANAAIGWPIAWYIFPVSIILGLFGVFMIETGCEAVLVLVLASIPLAIVLSYRPEYSLGKQLWLTALVGHGSGKLWVGFIR